MQHHLANETTSVKKARLAALLEVLGVSAKLGITSFGGPIAHLGYFHEEYIVRRRWMDERSYAELVALCQFLPGPASSQVGIGIGIMRAGLLGGVAAWIGFTLPSVLALVCFAWLLQAGFASTAGWVHGLSIVAVVVVAQALLGMGQKLANKRSTMTIAAGAAVIALCWQGTFTQAAIIAAAGVIGLYGYRRQENEAASAPAIALSRTFGAVCLVLFFLLLVVLPLARYAAPSSWTIMMDGFYRAGSLVFGGGHVVLPMLAREVVPSGLVSQAEFLTGYGAVQAVPGPLFTFASYLGAVAGGVSGAILATVSIFLPAFLLVAGTLPFWGFLRRHAAIQGALIGINAAVVGILLAALYDPLWTSAINAPSDCALAIGLFVLLVYWKLPPWVIVILGACGGMLV